MLIESMSKAFRLYSKTPFLFVWGSLVYIFLLIVCLFAAVGLFLIYFMALSAFDQVLNFESIPTLAVIGIIVLLFLFFANGLNAALAMTYRKALSKGKISVARFFSYAMDKAPQMFGIMIVREFIWILLVGPFLAIFTPAFVLAGGFGIDIFNSMKLDLDFLKQRHIFFIGLYIVFAIVWLLNFIPFVHIATLFFAYPVVYAAIVVMLDNTIRIKEEY